MKRRMWAISAIVLVLVAAAAYSPVANLTMAVQMALAVRSLASGGTGEELPVRQGKITRRFENRDLLALVYRPERILPKRALVFVAGISELGCYHPRLVALSRYLANRGFLVITPDIPAFRRFEVSAEPIDQIEFWFEQVRTMEGAEGVEHIGLAGISFSASLSMIAAARPAIRNDVAFLLGIGAYYDLHRCLEGWFGRGPITVPEGYYPTRFYAKWIIMKAALGMLASEYDRKFLDEVLVDLLLQKPVPAADPQISSDAKIWYELATMRENQSNDELEGKIEGYLTPILLRQIDPAPATAEVRCPVFLFHGAYDDLIPPEESVALKRHIRQAACHLLITPFLTHTHPLQKTLSLREKTSAVADSLAFFYSFANVVR